MDSQTTVSGALAAEPARAEHSRFVNRIRRRYAEELHQLPPGLPTRDSMTSLIDTLQSAGQALPQAMRVARQLVLERLAVMDVEQGATLEDVTSVMTNLAEVTLDRALTQAQAELDLRFGAPLNAAGKRIDFWVVGMGKLGGRELNVSSDIDLVYIYEDEGETTGPKHISAHEYFSLLARSLFALIGECTDDGFVFRVDLALRPNGDSGPPVVSLAMLEEYFVVQGREWERFAWLKSRVVAPFESVRNGRAHALLSTVTPFVYRRYLDYGAFEGLRQLHRRIRDDAQRRAAGRPERSNDMKLSRGGIREIEFVVQLLLVVRGGQFPEIRTRSTLKALKKLAANDLMKVDSAERFAAAYTLLRRVEHRIQYLDDQQTHQLPVDDNDLAWIARSLGMDCAGAGVDTCKLLQQLGESREFVSTEFDALLHDGRADPSSAKDSEGGDRCTPAVEQVDSEAFLAQLPATLAQRVRRWSEGVKIKRLRDESKLRLARLISRAAQLVTDERCTLDAAGRFVDWLEPLLRRESYLALLVERPDVQSRLLRLLGLARWPTQYLMRHPGVVDELADERLLHARFSSPTYIEELETRHTAWERAGQASEEFLLDTLRRSHHAEVFRTLVRDVENDITVEQVADDLSSLADATLQCAIGWAWKHFKPAHRAVPEFGIIAYGKLGGKELGYGSDLDVVFVYDDADEPDSDTAAEVYGKFVRKLMPWLTLRTAAGELFDIDTELRPNGNAGLLVTSVRSLENYLSGRGSNTAWTWEHQALTRARFCAGWPPLGPRFEAARRAVLCAPRNAQALRAEVRAMRDKVRAARPVKAGLFDVKHSPGGMMDVEFAVQCLVLTYGAAHTELLDNVGNIALLHAAEVFGLLPAGVGFAASDAYRGLRRTQHRARLDERPTQVTPETMATQRDAVLALWHSVFPEPK